MDLNEQPPRPPDLQNDEQLDLVGGPFAVVESDPGVFTSLTRKLGISGIELVELYDIEPWAVDYLHPHGLIFCFLWRKDTHRPADFEDPAADRVWFANQLSNDACASLAILNVLLNCPHVDVGEELKRFKEDTERMSPVMKGLAFTNLPILRTVHNSLSRPADMRGALNSIAITTLDEEKSNNKVKSKISSTSKRGGKPPPQKRAKTTATNANASSSKSAAKSQPKKKRKKRKKKAEDDDDDGEEEAEEEEGEELQEEEEEAYHFIGYVPAYGKVWELDGLKSGPLEVGELSPSPSPQHTSSPSRSNQDTPYKASAADWMDIVRPALRMKMSKYGGAAEGGDNIRFSLLAIVDGLYEKASDELRMARKKRKGLERRLGEGWEGKVNQDILISTQHAFDTPPVPNKPFSSSFGARRMSVDLQILDMPEEELVASWEDCAKETVRAAVGVEDELSKGIRANTDHIKRTFDYEPFFKAFVEKLQMEGHLNGLLGKDKLSKKKAEKG